MSKNSTPTHTYTLKERPSRRSRMCMPVLRVSVGAGEDIDMATRNAVENRRYKLVAWLVPGEEFVSPLVEGKLDPVWNLRFEFHIDPRFNPALLPGVFLHLEVIRASSDEPGTSRNSAVVGRARIRLPKSRKGPTAVRRYGLAVVDGGEVRPGGHINVLMEGYFRE